MSCGYNNRAVNLQKSACGFDNSKYTVKLAKENETDKKVEAVAVRNTTPPSNLLVGMHMSDVDTKFPDENNQGIGKPPPVSGDFMISMIMNARMAERSRRENGGRIDAQDDERACRNVPIGNTNVMQQECAKLSNRSIPNPLIDRLFAVQSRYME